jgi:type II secretory pathway pseudopilin PulG
VTKEKVKMKTLLRLLLKSQHQKNRSGPAQTEKGMTLVELLVGSIMAFLIITPMLGFVVDMLNTDRREQVKTNTEQDIQAALDFIAQDLSQAIYIYDNNTINNPAPDGTPGIRAQLPNRPDATPILVFWKRQQIRNAVSVNTVNRVLPIACNPNNCNDTYVRSLVAYYQIREPDPIWCQPLVNCPTRIARYEIKEGVRNPDSLDPDQPYYNDTQATPGQQVSRGFNPNFDFSQPRLNVTQGPLFPPPDVLVNYIDHTPLPPAQVPTGVQCQNLLGVTPPTGPGAPPFNPNDLLITTEGPSHSFYACVDTSRNLARVTIRGNSLRRLQPDNANYDPDKSAFFPTASVQVQGRGARGQ